MKFGVCMCMLMLMLMRGGMGMLLGGTARRSDRLEMLP